MNFFFQEGIKSDEEFPHTSDKGDFFDFAFLLEMQVVLSNHRIMAGGDEQGRGSIEQNDIA
jgi:hypothetical protein